MEVIKTMKLFAAITVILSFSANANVTQEYSELIKNLANKCSDITSYHPYKEAVELANENFNLKNAKGYKLGGIFSSGFIKFEKDNACKLAKSNFIINGQKILKKSKSVIPNYDTDYFIRKINLDVSKSLLYKYLADGQPQDIQRAIDNLNENYLATYSQDEFDKLTPKNKANLKKYNLSGTKNYFDPTEYYLATIIFPSVVQIGKITDERIEILFEHAKSFESKLLDATNSKAFDHREQATLEMFSKIFFHYSKNKEKNIKWQDKFKEYAYEMKDNRGLSFNTCKMLGKIDRLKKYNVKADDGWLVNFIDKNCTFHKTAKSFIKEFKKSYDHIYDAGSLQPEVARHAKGYILSNINEENSYNVCASIVIDSNKTIGISKYIVEENKDWFDTLKTKYCTI